MRPELILPLLCGLAAGALLAVQMGVNAQLGSRLKQPVLATLASFLVGSVALLIYCLLLRVPLPDWADARQTPAWVWAGGLLGAVYVVATVVLTPRLGSAGLVAVVVAGQVGASLVLDHFGLVGLTPHAINLGRVCGAALLMAGVALVLWS